MPGVTEVCNMVGFYEEMADFAAMSEDDGFLGQCAAQGSELFPTPIRTETPIMTRNPIARRGPRQLQLLVLPRRDALGVLK
jgi:hypothetical protein